MYYTVIEGVLTKPSQGREIYTRVTDCYPFKKYMRFCWLGPLFPLYTQGCTFWNRNGQPFELSI